MPQVQFTFEHVSPYPLERYGQAVLEKARTASLDHTLVPRAGEPGCYDYVRAHPVPKYLRFVFPNAAWSSMECIRTHTEPFTLTFQNEWLGVGVSGRTTFARGRGGAGGTTFVHTVVSFLLPEHIPVWVATPLLRSCAQKRFSAERAVEEEVAEMSIRTDLNGAESPGEPPSMSISA